MTSHGSLAVVTRRRAGHARPPARRSLDIGITVDPVIPVPPLLYGGIERIADFLVRGLADRGHRVTLFAHPDSVTPATLRPYGAPPHTGTRRRAAELWQLGRELWQFRDRLDVVHSFGRLAALVPVLPVRRLAKVQSYQREIIPWQSVRVASRLAGPSLAFTACSSSMWAAPRTALADDAGEWHTIYNGVDMSKYRPTYEVPTDAPLVCLGRIERVKGMHNAIAIARAAGRRLIIAGNRPPGAEHAEYFEREIAPHLDTGDVSYIGPVDDARKSAFLGGGAAFLMPIEWPEPFGIVMAEALACGTPIIGFPQGSVPEIVRPGINGFVAGSISEAVEAVRRLPELDRRVVRADCEARFGSEGIVERYERLYFDLVARS